MAGKIARVGQFVALTWLAALPAGAQTAVPEPLRPDPLTVSTARAVRVAGPAPKMDGRLDDPAWATAAPFGAFVQRDPDEGRPGTEPTEVRVLFTDDALWIGVRSFDSKAAEIAAVLARRDEWSPSDEVSVMIDSYHDRRTAFAFTVNAAGVKRDAYLYDDTNRDESWDAVWEAKATTDSAGWSAEFRIPLSQLRFPAAPSHTFGFNVSRRLNRLNETQFWRLVPKQASGYVSRFGDLTSLDGLRPPRRLEVLPYSAALASYTPSQAGNPFATGSRTLANLGGDLKVGLGSALTLTATANPDFGQVEADPAVVNLTAFESFFSERRPFFTEGLDLFRFRIADGDGDGSEEVLFYSRRIGRAPQGRADPRNGFAESIDRTTILAAGKLTGKTRTGWSVGALAALTDRERARVIDGAGQPHLDVVEPRTAYGVFRLERELRRGQTVIGAFGTVVDRDLPANLQWLHRNAYTAGLNWSHRFANDGYQLSGRVVASRVEGTTAAILATQLAPARYFQRPDADHTELDSTRTALGGYALGFNGGRTAGNLRWNLNFTARSPGFEANDAGFMRETDNIGQSVWINRRWLNPGRVFRRFNLNLNQWSSHTFGGERRNLGGNINANYTLLNYLSGWVGINRHLGGISPTALRGGPAFIRPGGVNGWFGLQTDDRKSVRGGTNFWAFAEDESENWGFGFGTWLSWRPTTSVDLTVNPTIYYNRDVWQYLDTRSVAGRDEYLFGAIRQTTTAMTLRSNITVSPTLSLQLYAQPFISSGRYDGFRRVKAPRAPRFADRFDEFGDRASRDPDGNVVIDLDGTGGPAITLGNPDFTVLSLRSNFVLRWEYLLGSTLFLVWQHGRGGFDPDGRFRLGDRLGDLFRSPSSNVLLVKLNYWVSL
ncbi:MAG: carbohydrate binding family 9 domain-containing protein [Gemmatimonadetes bacterium]|nr:carbohydrate binding family 9 domain-containing protein [Gemmatimonadota bacterium]